MNEGWHIHFGYTSEGIFEKLREPFIALVNGFDFNLCYHDTSKAHEK